MSFFELQTPRLRLVLPDLNQASAALDYVETNREHLRPTSPVLPNDTFTKDFWEKRLKKSIEEFSSDQSFRFFLELFETPGKFIGVVNFSQVARGPCYLGYSLDRDLQGKGVQIF
jgi:RimJ/RimL family protein N-acetyltransferase